jgi:photosystem II stability/assembly factor-like uncharacterized protein
MKNLKLFFLLAIIPSILSAQKFIKNTTGRALTFKEIQKQFDTFKKQNDLRKTGGWKSFKRWEHDMQMHTNEQGEPAGFDTYVNEAIAMSEFKQNLQNQSLASTWAPTGPNVLPNNLTGYMENGIGRINCVAFHPTLSGTYYVGVAQGGVWKTTNNGTSWTPLTDNLPITRISDISLDPSNPNTIYISVCDFEYIGVSLFLNGRKRNTHYGLGVYKSTDGGLTWAATGLTFQLTNGDASLIRKVLVNPTNSNDVCAAGASGMYKSANGGTTWTKVMDSLFWDLHQDPVSSNVLYASTGWVMNSNLGNAAVYKSTNFGNTWTMLNTGMPATGTIQRVKLAIAPSDNNYIYAACVDNQQGLYGFYKSTNAGLTWTYIAPADNVLEGGQGTNPGGQGNYDLGLLVNPTNKNTVYIGGVNMWASTDGANTFNPVSHWTTSYGPTIHGDFHYFAYQTSGSQFFVCSDGGLYKTSNIVPSSWSTSSWPTTWTKLNSGMQVTSFYKISSSKNAAGRLVAGAQDNGTFYYKGGTWSTIFGGDGMDNYIDPTSSTNVLGSSQYGNFEYSTNDGVSSITPNSNPLGEAAEWTTPVIGDPNTPVIVYLGNENVVKSTNGGNTWSTLTSMPGTNSTEISALAVSNTNSQVLYAARRVRYEFAIPGAVFKTTNGGSSWTNVTAGLPDSLYYTGIEIDLANANTVYICMAGFSSGRKVYKTTNAGVTWTNISYNLPNLPVNCIKQIPGTNNLIVATDIGIYILSGSATTWVNNSFGLPNVILSDIEFNVVLNKAYVATFGRGIWETPLNVLTGISGAVANNVLSFDLYPSVNNGDFTINTGSTTEKSVEVIDVMGRVVYSQKTYDEKIKLDLKLASGTYYVRIVNGDKAGVKQFVIQ